jgi:tetratricopeptide (TPR) repeat protein
MAPTKIIAKRSPRILAGKLPPSANDGRAKTLQFYEAALKLMQQGKYAEAHIAFDKMLARSPGDLAERIRMYINACVQQITKSKANFVSHEERYDYAVSLLNEGNYPDAREHFHAILKHNANADYAFYGLALLASMTGDSQQCLEHLTEAIRLNAQNRIQARADSDFQDMSDDPRFTELLYPEA